MHSQTVVQLCPPAEIFIAHRWEWECGWIYGYLSAPLNLWLSCRGQAASPRKKKSNQRLGHSQEGLQPTFFQQERLSERENVANEGRSAWSVIYPKTRQPESQRDDNTNRVCDWSHNSASLSFWLSHLLWSTWGKLRRGTKLIQTDWFSL